MNPSFEVAGGRRKVIFVASFAFASCALAGAAQAYVLSRTSNGTPLRWPRDQIYFGIAAAGSRSVPAAERARGREVRAARNAFQTWEAVAGSRVRFEYVGSMPDGSVPDQDDGFNTIVFYSQALPPELTDAIAVTAIVYGDRTGVLYDADILVNERDFSFSTFRAGGYVDLESVLLHEAGHLLGLDHTCGLNGETSPSCYDPALASDPARYGSIINAVMFPARAPGEAVRHALSADDIDAASFLYPADPLLPAPRVAAVTPAAVTAPAPVLITGDRFEAGATAHIALGAGQRHALDVSDATTTTLRGLVDPTGLSAGCYDVVVTQPSGKKGGLFGVLSIGGLSCEEPPPPKSGGCSAHAGADALTVVWLVLLGFVSLAAQGRSRRRRLRCR